MSMLSSSRMMNRSLSRLGALALYGLVLISAGTGWIASDANAEPAVKRANARIIGFFDHTDINSDEVFVFDPPPTTLVNQQEIDVDAGGITGIYTMPLAEAIGARVYAGPTFSKFHRDVADETNSYGLEIGGDVFWRDPEFAEIGLGTFYLFSQDETGSIDRSNHEAGLRAFGSLFFDDLPAFGSVDLDLLAFFSDADIDSDGAFSAMRTYGFDGGVRFYSGNRFSVKVGGDYTRTNFGTGAAIETAAAEAEAELLLPLPQNVTASARLRVGNREESAVGIQNFGRLFIGVGLSLTVSFTDAESLLELNRYYW